MAETVTYKECGKAEELDMRGSEEQERIIRWGGRTVETVTCKECGKTEELHCGAYNEKLKARSLCFSCDHWQNYVESDPFDPHAIVIKGRHYMIGDKAHGGESMSGFAGRKFIIEKFTGECIVTTNLWTQGKIPQRFRDRLPDNARFTEERNH